LANLWYQYQFSAKSDNIEILLGWGMGVIKGYISGSRDHDFWISRQILPAGSDFWTNPTTFYFRGGVSGCGHFPKFLGFRTMIFGFLVQF
jgi:hypothetical protein